MATANGKLVSVKPEHFHLPAKEDHVAVGPPTFKIDRKIDPAFSGNNEILVIYGGVTVRQ